MAAADAALGRLVARGAVLVPITIPNLRALSLAHGLGIAAEFSWAHDREMTNGWPIEPSTAVQLMVGRAISGVEVLAAHRLRSWGMEYVGKVSCLESNSSCSVESAHVSALLVVDQQYPSLVLM